MTGWELVGHFINMLVNVTINTEYLNCAFLFESESTLDKDINESIGVDMPAFFQVIKITLDQCK